MKNTKWQVMFGPTGHMLKKIKIKNNNKKAGSPKALEILIF